MTDDATLERDLRALLAARDPGPAPIELAVHVRRAMTVDRRPSILGGLSRVVAAAGLVAALLVVALIASRPAVTVPAASPALSPPVPYVMAAGDGVATEVDAPGLRYAAFLVVGGGLFVTTIVTTSRRTRIGAALGGLVLALVALSIGTSGAIEFGGLFGVNQTRSAVEGETGDVILAVEGDERFYVFEELRNTSKVPLTILGLGPSGSAEVGGYPGLQSAMATLPRLVAIGRLPGHDLTVEAILPFEPASVEPGDSLSVAILGFGGTCASPVPVDGDAEPYTVDRLDIVYEQLAIIHTQTLELAAPITVPIGPPCT